MNIKAFEKTLKELLAQKKVEDGIQLFKQFIKEIPSSLIPSRVDLDTLWNLSVELYNTFQETDLDMEKVREIGTIIQSIIELYIRARRIASVSKGYFILSGFYEAAADFMADSNLNFATIKEYYESAILCMEATNESLGFKAAKKFEINLSILSAALESEKKLIEHKKFDEAKKMADTINDFYCQHLYPYYDKMQNDIRQAKRNKCLGSTETVPNPKVIEQNAEAMAFVFEAFNILLPHFQNNVVIFGKAKYFARKIADARNEIELQMPENGACEELRAKMQNYDLNALLFHYNGGEISQQFSNAEARVVFEEDHRDSPQQQHVENDMESHEGYNNSDEMEISESQRKSRV